MGCASSAEQSLPEPLGIADFRKVLVSEGYQLVIPEKHNRRQLTDLPFLITFGICFIILFSLMGYSLNKSNVNRIYHGMDSCGNVCGQKNSHIDGITCSGADMTSKPYYSYSKLICVQSCDVNDHIFLYKCLQSSNGNWPAFVSDFNRSRGYVILFCFIGLVVTLGMMGLFRFYTSAVVWTLLWAPFFIFFALTGTCWYFYSHPENEGTKSDALQLGISMTIITVIWLFALLLILGRIRIFIALIKEAMKVIFGIPLLLVEPILTLLIAIATVGVYVLLVVIFATGGPLEYRNGNLYSEEPSNIIIFTIVFHTIMFLWMWEFIMGCQYMLIAGSASKYYFSKDKKNIQSPIYHSFYALIRYHLGTVALGSLIITIILIIKAFVRTMSSYKPLRCILLCLLNYLDAIVRYITKFAYIQTAMHGQPFCISGVRATRLLASNILSAVALNSVSGVVLFMAQVFIIGVTAGFGYLALWSTDIYYILLPVVLIGVVTAIIAYCFCSVLQASIDTLFISCCEDNAINDGEIHPYYRSVELDHCIKTAQISYYQK